jgi:hypothetical protein
MRVIRYADGSRVRDPSRTQGEAEVLANELAIDHRLSAIRIAPQALCGAWLLSLEYLRDKRVRAFFAKYVANRLDFSLKRLRLIPLGHAVFRTGVAMEQPIILHCHIPKTAGTSVSAHLAGIFGKLHLSHSHSDADFVLTPRILETVFEINPFLRSLSSHHLRVFPTRITGRPAHYITFLRDPTAALLSRLSYAQWNFKNLRPKTREFWPTDTQRLSLRDLARWYLDQVGEQECSSQTRFFCHREVLAKYHVADSTAGAAVHSEMASNVLKQFLFVGIVEDMSISVDVLDARLRGLGIRLGREAIFGKFRHQNRTRRKGNLAWVCEQDEVGRRLLACNAHDRILYSEFRKRLRASHREMLAGQSFICRYFPSCAQETRSDLPADEPLICDWAVRTCAERMLAR